MVNGVASMHQRLPIYHMVCKEVWGLEPLVQVLLVPEHEPLHGGLVQGFAGPDPEPGVRFRFEPGSRGSRTGPWPVYWWMRGIRMQVKRKHQGVWSWVTLIRRWKFMYMTRHNGYSFSYGAMHFAWHFNRILVYISKSCEIQVASVAAQVCTGLHSQYISKP